MLCLCLLSGCASAPSDRGRFEYARPQMGTVFRIVLYAPDEAAANAAAETAFARVDELNKALSDYDAESELSRLSRTAGSGQVVAVSDDLWTMLHASRMTSMHTCGAFDITVGPVVKLWRRARRQGELPPADQLAEALKAVGYEKLVLNPRDKTATLTAPDMRLDLGGIAKGYACDEAMKVLRERGITRAMVVGGGDVVVGEPPPEKQGWTVAMMPLGDQRGTRYLMLRNAAVSTSGDASQFVQIAGKRYSHIVDPRTGLALTTQMGVTVVAPNGTSADAYATVLNVLGPKHGLKLIDTLPHFAAIMVRVNDAGEIETYESTRVADLVFAQPQERTD